MPTRLRSAKTTSASELVESGRARCVVKVAEPFRRACKQTGVLGLPKSNRLGLALSRAHNFLEDWKKHTVSDESDLLRGRWNYKAMDCTPPANPRVRQIHFGGVLRAALVVSEDSSDCTMTFLLLYNKDEQDNSIAKACRIARELERDAR